MLCCLCSFESWAIGIERDKRSSKTTITSRKESPKHSLEIHTQAYIAAHTVEAQLWTLAAVAAGWGRSRWHHGKVQRPLPPGSGEHVLEGLRVALLQRQRHAGLA